MIDWEKHKEEKQEQSEQHEWIHQSINTYITPIIIPHTPEWLKYEQLVFWTYFFDIGKNTLIIENSRCMLHQSIFIYIIVYKFGK